MRSLFLCILLGTIFSAAGQTVIGMTGEPALGTLPWLVAGSNSYAGVYHFGVSEAESDLALAVDGQMVTAQIRSSEWVSRPEHFRSVYRTLSNVRIIGNKFYSAETNGEFISVISEGKRVSGLKIYKPWSPSVGKNMAEVGVRVAAIDSYYAGRYPQASHTILTAATITSYSTEQANLMRNEIYARYGFRFTKPALVAYFKNQSWYQPEDVSIDKLLTEIERKNIAALKAATR